MAYAIKTSTARRALALCRMSRIEKGTQRFRPAGVALRPSQPDGGGDSAAKPKPVPPPSRVPAESAGRAPATRILPRAPAAAAPTGAAPSGLAPTARSYAFASQPSTRIVPAQRMPITPRSLSQPTVRGAPPTPHGSTQPTFSPYERFLHAAQDDPQGVLQVPAGVDPSSVAELAAETWQQMSADARAQYGAPSATMPPAPATSRAATPRKRVHHSISDDEAEYQRQCEQQGTAAPDSDLPPLRIDIGTTRMESIAVTHWKSGRASSRTFELERVRARQLKKRREEAAQQDGDGARASMEPGSVKTSHTPGPLTPRETPAPEAEPQFGENRFAVQTRIVDGKIVLDEQSLYANYRDDEQQEREQKHWEVIDERESDQFVNSASRSKQRRTQRWSAQETEQFYQAVSQWGTDFEMITRLFPRRTRREIKAKWTKESRQHPQRLDDAFKRRVKVDLTAYGQAVGVDLSGPPPVITPRAEPKADEVETVEDTVQ